MLHAVCDIAVLLCSCIANMHGDCLTPVASFGSVDASSTMQLQLPSVSHCFSSATVCCNLECCSGTAMKGRHGLCKASQLHPNAVDFLFCLF